MIKKLKAKEISLKPCPRCGSSDVYGLVDKRGSQKGYVECADCGLKTKYGVLSDEFKVWNRKNTDRLKYTRVMMNKHGNTYISQFAFDLFGEEYIRKYIGGKLFLRETKDKDGFIVERKKRVANG